MKKYALEQISYTTVTETHSLKKACKNEETHIFCVHRQETSIRIQILMNKQYGGVRM